MSLPTTITLNVGSPAADVIYDKDNNAPGGLTLYYTDSVQDDLAGRASIAWQNKANNGGLMRSNVKFKDPNYDSSEGKYDGHGQVDITCTRPETYSVTDTVTLLEKAEKLLAQFKDKIANAES